LPYKYDDFGAVIKLRPMQELDEEKVLTWRNQPEVRKNMYTSHEISRQEHENWFRKVLLDPTKKYFICQNHNEDIGVVWFFDLDLRAASASWGFYSGCINQRGLGTFMERAALKYAFEVLELRKLSCEVLDFNQAVIRLHRKHGFRIEGIFKKEYYREGLYYDIFRLALNREDWTHMQSEIHFANLELYKLGSNRDFEAFFSEADTDLFSKITGDLNPIHFDDEYAGKYGFRCRILHGAMLLSHLSKTLAQDFPGPGTIIMEKNSKFIRPVYAGDKLTLRISVLSVIGNRLTLGFQFLRKTTMEVCVVGECKVLVSNRSLKSPVAPD
jgi:UDP-4-amino-4,6-dideoxy-N-acetyl-beta-L-altrosamine N-acetyltransferase